MNSSARPYPWRTFAALVGACVLTSPLVIPYYRALQAIATVPEPGPHMPTGQLVLAQMLRNLIFSVPAVGIGLLAARRIGLGAPYLESRLDGAPPPAAPFSSIVGPALLWATITAGVAFGIDAIFVHGFGVTFPAPEIHARIQVDWWPNGLASFWAPFAEETFDRLFLLSLIAWAILGIFRIRGEGRGRTAALWVANAATALFFGWYHISNEQMFAAQVPAIVAVRTVFIILPVGLAFGWLYFRRGLEAAILAHCAIDLIAHVVRPLTGWTG
jgi:hypothetical protein